MNMSYRRAWLLVDDMNRTFHAPVVATRFGGVANGRARLTPLGEEIVALYTEIEQDARQASDRQISRLEELIREGKNSASQDSGGRGPCQA
jgi:molybdate transport system regulatory protein